MDVNVRDYGAVGNDVHDDTLAFKNALNAIRPTGGTCHVPLGTYKISRDGITGNNSLPTLSSNMHLVGDVDPAGYARLHIHESQRTKHIIIGRGNGWSIENLTVDMSGLDGERGGPTNLGLAVPILADRGSNWTIRNCRIVNTGAWAVYLRAGSYFTFDSNYISCNNPSAHPVRGGVHSISTGTQISSYGKITNNVSDGCPIGGHARYTIFRNNTITNNGLGAGIYITAINYGSTDNTVVNNRTSFGKEGIDDTQNGLFFQTNGYEINSPNTLVFNNNSHNNKGTGMAIMGSRSVVAFNRCVDNGTTTAHENGISLYASNTTNSSYSLVFGNTCTDTRPTAQKTQEYGVIVVSDLIRCASFINNNFHGNEIGEGVYRNCQPNVGIIKGRDMVEYICNERQRSILVELFDPDKYPLNDNQYVMLNQLLTGSTLPRP